eukprot:359824-Pelagomonas_calceolata.AAC.2
MIGNMLMEFNMKSGAGMEQRSHDIVTDLPLVLASPYNSVPKSLLIEALWRGKPVAYLARMNNNRLDEAALSAGGKGVFSKPSYITIGSKERPEEYGKKLPVRSSEKGKQLSTVPPKEGKTIDAYFEKKHNWINDVSLRR